MSIMQKSIFRQLFNRGPVSVALSVLLSALFVTAVVNAATTISTNIQTDGALSVTGQSTLGNASTTNITTTGSIWVNGFATTTGSTGAIATQGALTVSGLTNVIGGIRSQPTAGGQSNERYGGGTLGAIQSAATGNTALGEDALMSLTTGDDNVGLGYQALRIETTGSRNTGAGVFSLYYNVTGSNNVALGYSAGLGVSTNSFSNNIFIGYQAADNVTTGSNNVAIGYDIDIPSASASNQLTIGNLIFGTGIDGTGTTVSSGNVGIGTSSPYARLSVVGEVVAQYFTATSTTATSTFAGGFLAAGSSGLTVLQNGNVGIGTAGPTVKLSVLGNNGALNIANLLNDANNAETSIYIGNSLSAGRSGRIAFQDNNNTTSGYLFLGNYGDTLGTGGLVIQKGGNVGIGTTTPLHRLHISNGANATTTVTIGELGLTTSKACVNMNQADGSPGSFYLAGGAIVVANSYCQ